MVYLAIDGGEPVRQNKISIARTDIGSEEALEAKKTIETGWVTEGPKTKEFEEAFAKLIGTKHAIAMNSGTAALHTIVRALGIKEGMTFAVPSFTFISSANCCLFEKAKPIFIEIEEDTFNLSTSHLKDLLKKKKIDALVAVDLFGHPANWDEITEIAKKYNLPVIEDAAESHMSKYKGKMCGSFGDAGAFSFYPTKNMTTGEGGMVTTNNDNIANLCRRLKNLGRLTVNENHELLGYNYRLSDILSAIGLIQLKRIDSIIEKRRQVAKKYTTALSSFDGITPPIEKADCKHTYMNYVLRFDNSKFKKDRDYFVKALNAEGIGSKVYFDPPVHLQPLYQNLFSYRGGELPISEKISKEVFSLPMSSLLIDDEIEDVICAVEKVSKALHK